MPRIELDHNSAETLPFTKALYNLFADMPKEVLDETLDWYDHWLLQGDIKHQGRLFTALIIYFVCAYENFLRLVDIYDDTPEFRRKIAFYQRIFQSNRIETVDTILDICADLQHDPEANRKTQKRWRKIGKIIAESN